MSDTFFLTVLIYLMGGAILSGSPFMLTLWLLGMALVLGAFSYMKICSWLSYMFIAVYAGGVLVCALYVASFAGNDKFHLQNYSFLVESVVPVFFLSLLSEINYFSASYSWGFSPMLQAYSPLSCTLVLFLVFYMLIALVLCVKLSEIDRGAVSLH